MTPIPSTQRLDAAKDDSDDEEKKLETRLLGASDGAGVLVGADNEAFRLGPAADEGGDDLPGHGGERGLPGNGHVVEGASQPALASADWRRCAAQQRCERPSMVVALRQPRAAYSANPCFWTGTLLAWMTGRLMASACWQMRWQLRQGMQLVGRWTIHLLT